MTSIYDLKFEGIDGEEMDFAGSRGKKIIIVNVASECGFTSQYQQLEELFDAFKDKVNIFGFPSNDFGGQEPGTNAEIKIFCETNYKVNFPLASKISIKTHPVYKWLTDQKQNGVLDSEVKWNFQKYLIDETGKLDTFHPSEVSPLDSKIVDWIKS